MPAAGAPAGTEPALLSIWLRLGGDHDLSLHGAGAGTGVVARTGRPEPVELTATGHLELRDAAGRFGFVPGRVVRVWEVSAKGAPIGVRWQLAYGPDVVVCFIDDAWSISVMGESVPPAVQALGEPTFAVLYDENA